LVKAKNANPALTFRFVGGFIGGVGEDKIFSDHNVYILGAGFSADAGIPVIKHFLNVMRDSLNFLRDQGREWERKAVEDVLVFRKEAASAALRVKLNIENIEDLFSLAAALTHPRKTGPGKC
jgi:hypothetical protein